MKHQFFKTLILRVLLMCAVAATGGLVAVAAPAAGDYLFLAFAMTRRLFSSLLSGVFVLGLFTIIDRVAFGVIHGVLRGSLLNSQGGGGPPQGVYGTFLRHAREFRARSEQGVYSEDIVTRAREMALREDLHGQEIDSGRSWLEFLGTAAPSIGFAGTLVGLIASFQELSVGGDLAMVLGGMALSLTSSLLGALISLFFLSSAWLLGQAGSRFDRHLEQMIAKAQKED